ncbi:hypothetical protein BUALT_Bualt09G0110100 [Buddleja alternifolia]|uniref:SAWADEE domain-containing protein n=1 Tax=Buddleja alternifolia TaxID=168488 RepID=A0AAV6X5Y9_9LAMI|nr:hypothetical protein BUALT_Bualt09G0110100 [Buddleja alternifolia]
MADGGCIVGAENDVVELEAMRKGSFSWHPCQVSLCSRGLGLIVQYGDNNVDEMIGDKEGVLARIRVRSTPLQGDDCSFIQQGDHVLATQNTSVKDGFCDARVEEVMRVRHSKRTHCRCSFTIKWLHQALEGEPSTVPASAIMKLATKSIILHPTISTFFSMLESSNDLDTLPSSTIADSMNWEMDINVLLEKQIEEISNSTDVSQTKISKNFVFGFEVDVMGQGRDSATDASLKDLCIRVPSLDKSKGSTHSENKEAMETTLGNPPASVQEGFNGSRSPLNPLAARAALASLRSNFPQSVELSVQSNVKKGADDFPLEVSATIGDISPKVESIVKTLFPTSSDPQIVEFFNVPSRSQKNGMEKKNKNSVKTITQPSETRRTRAQIQRNNGVSESTQATNTKEIKLQLPSNTRRMTRSSTNGAEKIEVKDSNGTPEGIMPSKSVQLDTAAKNTIAPQNCVSKNKKAVTSPIYSETSICSAENGKSLLGRGGMIAEVDPQKMTFAEDTKNRNHPKRQTRSTARAETDKNNVQSTSKFSKSNISEQDVDLFEGSVTPESNKLGHEIPIISPVATKTSEHVTEEGEKERRTSSHVKATPITPAETVALNAGTVDFCTQNVVGSSKGIKRKLATARITRFSPRLRYHTRTRSEKKA